VAVVTQSGANQILTARAKLGTRRRSGSGLPGVDWHRGGEREREKQKRGKSQSASLHM